MPFFVVCSRCIDLTLFSEMEELSYNSHVVLSCFEIDSVYILEAGFELMCSSNLA